MSKSLLFALLSLICGLLLTAGSIFISKTEEGYHGDNPLNPHTVICASVNAGRIDKQDSGFPLRYISSFTDNCMGNATVWHPLALIGDIALYGTVIFGGLWFMRRKA